MGAGTYRHRLEWGQRTPGDPDGYGQRTYTYPSQGYVWCAVEELTGGRATRKDAEGQLDTATIRVRNAPAIVAGDQLAGDGYTWTVLSVVAGDNELVIDAEG